MPEPDLDDFYDEAPATPDYGIDLPGMPRGRYIYPDPPGYQREPGEKPGFRRMTNHASAFSDQIKLQHWRERLILLGLREDEVLYDELHAAPLETMDPMQAKAWLEAHADRAASRAKGDTGARRGTARHVMLQTYLEEGVITGTRTMRLQLESLLEALDAHHLEPIPGLTERRVCNTEYRAAGTLDMGVLCRRTGQIGILDLKTARQFWSYLEIAGQQQGYDGARWMWEGPHGPEGRWVQAPIWNLMGTAPWTFGKRVALLAHMPQEPGPNQLPVEIHEVDLTYGHEVMVQAGRNIELRSRGCSKAEGRRVGGPRPVPVEVDTPAIAG